MADGGVAGGFVDAGRGAGRGHGSTMRREVRRLKAGVVEQSNHVMEKTHDRGAGFSGRRGGEFRGVDGFEVEEIDVHGAGLDLEEADHALDAGGTFGHGEFFGDFLPVGGAFAGDDDGGGAAFDLGFVFVDELEDDAGVEPGFFAGDDVGGAGDGVEAEGLHVGGDVEVAVNHDEFAGFGLGEAEEGAAFFAVPADAFALGPVHGPVAFGGGSPDVEAVVGDKGELGRGGGVGVVRGESGGQGEQGGGKGGGEAECVQGAAHGVDGVGVVQRGWLFRSSRPTWPSKNTALR